MKEHYVTINKKITDDDLVDILCGATGTACLWCSEIYFSDEAYATAKRKLLDAGIKENDLCYEDVLLQMLKNGDQISFYDEEDDEEYFLSWGVFMNGIEMYMNSKYCESLDIDEWDDTDYDAVIQYAFFGELVFG